MSDNNRFTPTQRAILNVLADGQPHTREELHACLPDELGAVSNIKRHLSAMRKVLRLRDEDILCQYYNHAYQYRHIKLLTPYRDAS